MFCTIGCSLSNLLRVHQDRSVIGFGCCIIWVSQSLECNWVQLAAVWRMTYKFALWLDKFICPSQCDRSPCMQFIMLNFWCNINQDIFLHLWLAGWKYEAYIWCFMYNVKGACNKLGTIRNSDIHDPIYSASVTCREIWFPQSACNR